MRTYTYALINVFAESPLAGNPLCVFENAEGLSTEEMQALALQFNLSETTFLLPSAVATRKMRIFTPAYEMPFAGHPTLGSASVVGGLTGQAQITLETQAGVVPVQETADARWRFKVPSAQQSRPASAENATLAAALNIAATDIIGTPLYVNTGVEQFIIPLASREAVMRVEPDVRALSAAVRTVNDRYMAYVYAWETPTSVVSRFFFPTASGMSEDPGTGSACANLGGYLQATGKAAPFSVAVDQGERTGRRCALSLDVTVEGTIFVGGRCAQIGEGTISWPE